LVLLVLFLIPFINSSDIRNTTYRPIFKFCFWFFIADFIILTWVGQKPVKDTFILVGQIATFIIFFFLILIPIVGKIESALVHYKSD
jgi:ubiquinol-cytochrome c reductase cytochrome b subunit